MGEKEVIAEGTMKCWFRVSFGGWSRTSGAGLAGCWRTEAEPTRIRTSWRQDDTRDGLGIREGKWRSAETIALQPAGQMSDISR